MTIFESFFTISEISDLTRMIKLIVIISTLIASLTTPSEGHVYYGRRNGQGYGQGYGQGHGQGYGRRPRLRSDTCPNSWFTAEFVTLADVIVRDELLLPDPDFTFFRNIMLFSDEETQKFTQDAINFFHTKYGLNFAQSALDVEGQRTFENAVLMPFIFNPEVRYTITVNAWILTGRFRNFCYENRDGGYVVQFKNTQLLRGEYGGSEGIPIQPGELLLYGFYNIPVCPWDPVIIQYQSGTPFRFEPIDNLGVINCELSHETLGKGAALGIFRSVPTGEDNLVHVTIRNVLAFPASPGLN